MAGCTQIVVFKDKRGYRWMLEAANGKVLAIAPHGHGRRTDARRSAARVASLLQYDNVPIVNAGA